MASVTLEHVKKIYDNKVTAVHDFNLEIKDKEFVVFVGPSGCGKSSSYNVAVGLYQWVNTNDFQGYFTRFCAGGVLVAVPITALFLALQKYYVEGVTGGAVKG